MNSSNCNRLLACLEPVPWSPVAKASRLCSHRRDGGVAGRWGRLLVLAMLPLSLRPAIVLADPPNNQDSTSTARQAQRITPAVKVFQETSPAVVNLSTTTVVTVRDSFGFGGLFDEIFDFPMARPRQYEAHSVGSGFVIHRDGYIVTNAHVIDRASECKVTFADGTELPAVKVAVERRDDLAILKVEVDPSEGKKTGPPFPIVKLGRSDDLMPGETVIAVGNPLGYQHTVTTGIISALNRELRFGKNVTYSGLIQIDASINPGNSGGPLLNVLGELIGINTAIRGDAQNIGFAIAVDRLHALLPEMLDVERLRRAKLGIHFSGEPTEQDVAGIRVKRVDAGSGAAKAGVRPGDIVTGINGKPTPDFLEAFTLLEAAPLGKEIAFDLLSDGRKRKTVKLPLEEIPRLDSATVMWDRFGIRVQELTRADMTRLGLRQRIALRVAEVDPRSQAAQEGVSPDDLITRFGGRPVTSLDALGSLLEQVKPGDRIPVGVWRVAENAIVQVELPLTAR